MKKLNSLSIFFPTLNDSKTLPLLIKKAHNIAQIISNDFEIIVINDGSTDNTYNVLEGLKKQYHCLKVIHHSKNMGYGGALQSGFKAATKEWVFYTDGDGQYDPNELIKLVDKVNNNVDVVNGYKLGRNDTKLRILIGKLYNSMLHKIYSLPISDIDCDFRLIRRSVLNKINLTSSSGIICLELILKLKKINAKFVEVGVHHYDRIYGKSQFFNIKHLTKTAIDNTTFLFKMRS